MYKDKIAIAVNYDYFLEHAEEIINDTEHILNPYAIGVLAHLSKEDHERYEDLYWYYQKLKETHKEMWMMFGRGDWFMKPGETDRNKALDRVDHEYCEATGRWDLFIWGTKEDLDRIYEIGLNNFKKEKRIK